MFTHAGRVKAGKKTFGESKGTAKLTTSAVRAIRDSDEPNKVLGNLYGIDPSHIAKIRRREYWTHV